MSLDVTLGYPKMVCSQVFRVYRHVMITMGWVGPRSFVGSELLTFYAVKVSWEEVLPQIPRNVTQDWLFLD